MRPHVDGLRARGVDAHAIDLPKRKAEDAVPAYVAALDALPPMPTDRRLVVGGHSYGGRVASLMVAGVNVSPSVTPGDGVDHDRSPIAGLVCFSYPLHLPGRPERGLRTEHWSAIHAPTLILEGESDPFARLELLRDAMPLLPRGSLVTWPRVGHGLGPVLDQALDAVVAWLDDAVRTVR